MELIVFGLNHRTAPLEVREHWALSGDRHRATLRCLSDKIDDSEHVILCTCNRTEFYSIVPVDSSPLGPQIALSPDQTEILDGSRRGALEFYHDAHCESARSKSAHRDEQPASGQLEHFYVYRQEDAVEHLFRLAGGLDSMIVGESQILKQLKDAFAVSQEAKTTGSFLHRLFPTALRVGKRVRTTTTISNGCITPGQAALELARGVYKKIANRRILVVGSGKIAGLTVQAIHHEGLAECFVVNRTHSRAKELIDRIGAGTPMEWSRLGERLRKVDIVVSSTGSVDPIVTSDALKQIQLEREGRPLVIIDLAIPRDFQPTVSTIPGVHLFNIDDLNQVIQQNFARRHSQVPIAEEIIREEVLTFQRQMVYRQVDPVLKHINQRFEQIRLGVLQKYMGQFPEHQHELVHQVTSALLKKLLYFPIAKLKSLRDLQDLSEDEVHFLRRLFLTDPPNATPNNPQGKRPGGDHERG